MTIPTLADVTVIPDGLQNAFEADDWTVQRLSTAKPKDLTGYDGVGLVTARKIIDQAKTILADEEVPSLVSVRSLAATRLIVPLNPAVSGTVYTLTQRYVFGPGQTQMVPADDARVLLELKTKPQGCCNSDEKPRRLFDVA